MRSRYMIKRILRSTLALALAVSLMASEVPVDAQTQSSADVTEDGITLDSDNYAEGQAIIMYDNSSYAAKAFTSGTEIKDDITVAETYEFDTDDTDTSISTATSSDDGFTVALVESEQYSTEELITYLNKKSYIKYAEPNYTIKVSDTDDPYKTYQWALDNTGQNGGTEGYDINADTQALQTSIDSEEKVVAIIDTGLDYTHEDLADVAWENPFNSKKLKGKHGYDFYNYDSDPMDDNGHGTHCAGIIAAQADNGVGISGTATSSNIKIMSLKVFSDEGYGSVIDAIAAYNYIYKAQSLGVNIVAINNSWNSELDESDADDIIAAETLTEIVNLVGEAGALSMWSAGNDASENTTSDGVPTCIDSDYIVTVAATNGNDELASFSNYGSSVDIAAPGTSILSTVSYDTFNPTLYDNKDDYCALYEDFENTALVLTMEDSKENGVEASGYQLAYGLDIEGSGTATVSISDDQYFGKKEDGTHSLKWTVEGASAGDVYTLYLPYSAEQSSTALYESMGIYLKGPTDQGDNFDGSVFYLNDGPVTDGTYDEKNEVSYYGAYLSNNTHWAFSSYEILSKVTEEQKRAVSLQIYAESDGDYTIYIDNFGISKSDVDSSTFGKYDFYNGTSMATPYVTGAVAAIADAFDDDDPLARKARILSSVRTSTALDGKVSTEGVLDLSDVDSPHISVLSCDLIDDDMIQINGYYLKDATVTINGNNANILEQTDSHIIIDGSDYLNRSITLTVTKDDVTVSNDYYFSSGESFTEENSIDDGYLDGGEVVSDGETLYYISDSGDVCTATPDEDDTGFLWTDYGTEYSSTMFDDTYSSLPEYTIYNESAIIYYDGRLYEIMTIDMGYAEDTAILCFDEDEGWHRYAELPDEMTGLSGVTLGAYDGSLYIAGGLDEETGACGTTFMSYNKETGEWTSEADMPEGRCFAQAIQTGENLVLTLGANGTDNDIANMIYDGSDWTVSKEKIEVTSDVPDYTYTSSQGEVTIPVLSGQIGIIEDGIVYTDIQAEGLGDTFTYDVNDDQYESTGYSLDNSISNADALVATTFQDKLYVLYSSSESAIGLCSIPVECGYVQVIDESDSLAYVDGAGYYVPGDTITLIAKLYDDESGYITSFTVDGEDIAADSEGEYIYETMADGSSYTLTAAVSASTYTTETSNSTENTVDNSNVTTVTPTPQDNTTLSVGTKVKVGKFTYKITKSSTSKKTVTCVSLNKKKTKKAVLPASITINGSKYKVKAIATKAFKNCKKLRKLKIKSKKITKIGKKAFKKTSKKLVVKVPAKCKKKYKKMLRKAGCRGKIK